MNAPQPIFVYDQNIAASASSGGKYIIESCVARGFIESAEWTQSDGGAHALEFTFESEKGQKASFLTVYYQNKDGSVNEIGTALIQSMMGATGVKALTQKQNGKSWIAPEFARKPIMLALERENYFKGDGSEGFKFNIKCAMSPRSGLTVAEHINSDTAKSAEYWTARFAENPKGKPAANPKQRTSTSTAGGHSQQQSPQYDNFDDDIPF